VFPDRQSWRAVQPGPIDEAFAVKSTKKPAQRRLVWRITPEAPMGEWVDPSLPPPPRKPVERDHTSGFMTSSMDLLGGADVDSSADTVPDHLFDELFPRQDLPPKKSAGGSS
jgi:hypothetical protein